MRFRAFLVRRLLSMAVTFWGILTLVFLVARVLPSDPAQVILGTKATPEQLRAIREQYGLNDPLWVQYVDFFRDFIFRFDLGYSFATQRPVAVEIVERFPATFELTTAAILVALVVGVPLGILSAVYKDDTVDHGTRLVAISGVSVPRFWMAILVQLLFFFYLGWLPATGRFPQGATPPAEVTGLMLVDSVIALRLDALVASVKHLFLPAVVLSLGPMAQATRITRSSMIDTLNMDYIEWSRAHGIRSSVVLFKHALRNAIMPTITAIGLTYGLLLGGAVVIEIVFNIRGIGFFLYQSILTSDFNGILGVTIVFSLGYLVVNFLVDVLHSIVNPEIEVGG